MEFERKEFVARWLPELAQRTRRSESELREDGLLATDFSMPGVGIDYEDGSSVRFRGAFHVTSAARPGRVAIFTEHCGYHEFSVSSDDRVLSVGHGEYSMSGAASS
jgi:hypothetical protein